MTAAPAAAWAALRSMLGGRAVLPGEDAYAQARQLFSPRFDDLRPAGVAYVAGPADVATCLEFARRHGVPVAVRSGGHSYAGWSSGTGRLVIDVSELTTITVAGSQATIGAGARLGQIYDTLGASGVSVPGGTCPTVGIAGLALGGGHGVTTRAYGLTCDSLVAATVVTADGSVVVCSAEADEDLFWALRGAGNGNFGVVTELTFRTYRIGDTHVAALRWPWRDAAAVMAAWAAWAPAQPAEIWSALRLTRSADGVSEVRLNAASLGSRDAFDSAMDRLPGGAEAVTVTTQPHLSAMHYFAGPDRLAPVRHVYAVRSDFLARLDTAAIQILGGQLEQGRRRVTSAIAITALGGAVDRVTPEATAFVHRGYPFLAQYEAEWGDDASAETGAQQWLDDTWRRMRPHASGAAYQNCPDPQLRDWRTAYYGSALPRLAEVKKRYDPDRRFDHPHAV